MISIALNKKDFQDINISKAYTFPKIEEFDTAEISMLTELIQEIEDLGEDNGYYENGNTHILCLGVDAFREQSEK